MSTTSHQEFCREHSDILRDAFDTMCKLVRDRAGMTVQITFQVVSRHVFECFGKAREQYFGGADAHDVVSAMRLTDVQWTGAVLHDDKAADAALGHLIVNDVNRAIVRRSSRRNGWEDVANEVYLRVKAAGESGEPRLAQYTGRSALKSWLIGIGIRLALNKDKSEKKNVSLSGSEDNAGPQIATSHDSLNEDGVPDYLNRLMLSIMDAATALPAEDKIVFTWAYMIRLPQNRIAELLDITPAAVSQKLKKIRKLIVAAAAELLRDIESSSGIEMETLEQHLDSFLKNLQLPGSVPDEHDVDPDEILRQMREHCVPAQPDHVDEDTWAKRG